MARLVRPGLCADPVLAHGKLVPLVLAILVCRTPCWPLLLSAVPWGRRWDLRAGIVALVILSATSALAPSYTRLEPDAGATWPCGRCLVVVAWHW